MELHPHQSKALGEMKNGCVLAGDVGSGKTLTSLAYYVTKVCGGDIDRLEPPKHPKPLLVLTTALKRDTLDWESEALHFGIFTDPEVSYTGQKIVIDSWNNIKKYADLEGWFIILDEQRVPGAGAWAKTFIKMSRNNEWIMLSATPADTWMDYVPLFIAHGFYRNRTEFVEQHVVWSFHGSYRKIRGFYGVRHLERLRDDILVEMPYKRHTTRHLVAEPVSHDVERFAQVWKKRWNVYEDAPLVDSAEMHRVGRRVVNEDPSRLDAIERLSIKHPRMIIFYNFNYELEALRTLCTRLDMPVAEWNGHRHEPVPDGLRWLYLVQYQAGAEGWNCTTTDTIVYYSLTYSHKIFEQSQGRIDRMNTPYSDLYYYVLMSTAKIDKIIWRALVLKKNFHEGKRVKFVSEANE